jgi:hypothetical protein
MDKVDIPDRDGLVREIEENLGRADAPFIGPPIGRPKRKIDNDA